MRFHFPFDETPANIQEHHTLNKFGSGVSVSLQLFNIATPQTKTFCSFSEK